MGDYTFEMAIDLQITWSDRLPRATAADYGRLLAMVSKQRIARSR